MDMNVEFLCKMFPGIILLEGYNDAIIGITNDIYPAVIYDYDEIINILMKNMSREDAESFFDYNIDRMLHGPNFLGNEYPLPIVMQKL